MGIERLSNAARAAGYAMATSEDLLTASTTEIKAEAYPWRSAGRKSGSNLISPRIPRATVTGEWRRSFYGLLGWGAAA